MIVDIRKVQQTCSVVEAAQVLGIGRNVAYHLAATGLLPALRLGRQIRVSMPALQKLIENPQLLAQQTPLVATAQRADKLRGKAGR